MATGYGLDFLSPRPQMLTRHSARNAPQFTLCSAAGAARRPADRMVSAAPAQHGGVHFRTFHIEMRDEP